MTVVVPGWIQRALLRNRLNTIDLLEYSKVRQVLSLDDMAEWVYMNDRFEINRVKLSNCHLGNVWHSLSPTDKLEIQNSVQPLSGSEEIASSANHKLNEISDKIGNPLGNQNYQFIRIDNILYVVLSEGFLSTMKDQALLREFIEKYLKECYAMVSVADVSKLSIFELYMKQFAI